jgi:transposase InsO family protein
LVSASEIGVGPLHQRTGYVDDVTRECLAAVPDTSISGKWVARELTTLIQRRGKPCIIVSDHGTELTSNAILAWCAEHRVDWHYIAPGKPMQNGGARARRHPERTFYSEFGIPPAPIG